MAFGFNDFGNMYQDELDSGYRPQARVTPHDILAEEPEGEPDIVQELRQRNNALLMERQRDRDEANRRLARMEGRLEAFTQVQTAPRPEAPKQKDPLSFWDNEDSDNMQSPPKQDVIPPDQYRRLVREEVAAMGQEHTNAAAEENRLAAQFANEFPDITRAFGREVHAEWEKLKRVNPNMSNEQRYEVLRVEANNRWAPKVKQQRLHLPPSGNQSDENVMNLVTGEDRRTRAEFLRSKNAETARAVLARQRDQRKRTGPLN